MRDCLLPRITRTLLTTCLLGGIVLATASCDETFIDPFDNEGRYFTIYGFLHSLETEHSVRVIPLTRDPERITSPSDPQADLDATVTSTDLTTGETTRWRHTLEPLTDGTYAHIFRASFIIEPLHTFRLEVHRSDGATASAETKVPYIGEAFHFERSPVYISPDTSVVTQEIYIPHVPSLWNIRAAYDIANTTGVVHILDDRFFVHYGRVGERTEDGGWRVTINLLEDQANVREQIADFQRRGIYEDLPKSLTAMGLYIHILDENWNPPEGIFDPEVLSQPGMLSNVDNGYGFWGSVGTYVQEWSIDTEFSVLLGYDG